MACRNNKPVKKQRSVIYINKCPFDTFSRKLGVVKRKGPFLFNRKSLDFNQKSDHKKKLIVFKPKIESAISS